MRVYRDNTSNERGTLERIDAKRQLPPVSVLVPLAIRDSVVRIADLRKSVRRAAALNDLKEGVVYDVLKDHWIQHGKRQGRAEAMTGRPVPPTPATIRRFGMAA
jgi:hypothetical protein